MRGLRRLICLTALVLQVPSPGYAKVWVRTRADGVQEFTNLTPRGGGWRLLREPDTAPPPARAPVTPLARPPAPSTAAGAVWTRENEDGTVEFTNLTPIGARWKVLFRTGPGKASSIRGASDLVPARDTSPARFFRYDAHIRDQQLFYGIPTALIRAIIKTESDFDPHVVSSAGAVGLMQLLPDTARAMGVTDILDPRQNIMGGARFLQMLAKRYCKTPAGPVDDRGSPQGLVCSFEEKIKVLAGYHAGPGAVDKYAGMPPYETTRAYVINVLARYEQFRKKDALQGGSLVAKR